MSPLLSSPGILIIEELMNGWEITCVIVGFIVVVDSVNWLSRLVGALMVLVPLYFNFWS